MYCPNCGKELPVDGRFCPSCGQEITPAVPPTPAKAAATVTLNKRTLLVVAGAVVAALLVLALFVLSMLGSRSKTQISQSPDRQSQRRTQRRRWWGPGAIKTAWA